jgi:PKD repeat protein
MPFQLLALLLVLFLLTQKEAPPDEPPPEEPTLELGPPIFGQIGAGGQAVLNLTYTLSPEGGGKVWSVAEGPAGAEVGIDNTGVKSARFTFSVAGNYLIQLSYTVPVTGQVLTDAVVCQIDPAPLPAPTLNLGPDAEVVLDATGKATLTLNYSASGTITSKQWQVVTGPVGAQVEITDTGATQAKLTFTVAGAYMVKLTVTVSNTSGSVSDEININVTPAPAPPAVRVITGPFPNGFTVPEGETWEMRGEVTMGTDLRSNSPVVHGVLQAFSVYSPHLKFLGVKNSTFVGGAFVPETSPVTDPGLWVRGKGQLNFQGARKAAWGYGMMFDPTWLPTDQMVEGPLFNGEITAAGFKPYVMGNPLRTMRDGRKLPTFNLTRSVKISGTGPDGRAHVHINSTMPQIFRYVEESYMAPQRLDADGNNVGVLGRYALHFHECGNGSRGSIVEGVVIKHTGNLAFVTHESHGVAHRDNIGYDVQNGAYTWDRGTMTNDILYDRCVGAWVRVIPSFRGTRLTAFNLGRGTGNKARGCLAVGVMGNRDASGFFWPEDVSQTSGVGDGVWEFVDNTSLANKRHGAFTWQNTGRLHQVPTQGTFVSINCGGAGISHGAYLNRYQYGAKGKIVIYCPPGGVGIVVHALPGGPPIAAGYSLAWEGLEIHGGAHGIVIARHGLPSSIPQLFRDIVMTEQTGKKVVVVEDSQGGFTGDDPGLHDSVNCGLNAFTDFDLAAALPGTRIRVQQGTQAWQIVGKGAPTPIAPFYS